MADADDLDARLVAAEELADGFGLRLDGAGRGFLDEDVAVLPVLEGEEHEVDGLVQAHYEAGHRGFGDRDGLASADLVDPERDDGSAAAHYVAVARAADPGRARMAAFRDGDLFLEGLADAHCVDGICGLVGAEADDALHTGFDGRGEDVVRSDNVCAHGLHREELAARDLLQRCRVEYIIDPRHRAPATLEAPHVPYVEFDLVRNVRVLRLVLVPHVVLLLLVSRENADLSHVRAQEPPQHSIPERPGPTGNQKCLVFEYGHIVRCIRFHFSAVVHPPPPPSGCFHTLFFLNALPTYTPRTTAGLMSNLTTIVLACFSVGSLFPERISLILD